MEQNMTAETTQEEKKRETEEIASAISDPRQLISAMVQGVVIGFQVANAKKAG